MTQSLQVDLLIVMGMGDSKGLGDPGAKGVFLKLAHPRRDTCGTSRKRAGLHWLHHLQGVKDSPDSDLQKVVPVAFSLKHPSHLGELPF